MSPTRKFAVLLLVVLTTAGFFGFTKAIPPQALATEIASLETLGQEKLYLQSVDMTDKSVTLMLEVSDVTPETENITKLKSYYELLTMEYICQSPNFDKELKKGYQISFDIRYQLEPSVWLERGFISKDSCQQVNSQVLARANIAL